MSHGGEMSEETVPTNMCLTCHKPTHYDYLCEECSELFLIELWEGGRQRGLRT